MTSTLAGLFLGRSLQVPDQSGRTFLITGATSGIGRYCTEQLSAAGARVILAVRNTEAGRHIAEQLPTPGRVLPLDLADLRSVREGARRLDEDVDVVIGNAGVMQLTGGQTRDGFEINMGVNHLGHFALVGQILPRIRERYVAVSSYTHRRARIDVPRMELPPARGGRTGMAAYGASKLACQLFALELNRRLALAGSPVKAVAGDPGYTASDLFQDETNPYRKATLYLGAALFAMPVEKGAAPILAAATADLPGGALLGGIRPGVRPARPGPAATPALAAAVWARSVELTGVDFGGL